MNGIKRAILLTIKGDFDGFMKESVYYRYVISYPDLILFYTGVSGYEINRNVIPCYLWLLFLRISKQGLSA